MIEGSWIFWLDLFGVIGTKIGPESTGLIGESSKFERQLNEEVKSKLVESRAIPMSGDMSYCRFIGEALREGLNEE